MFLESKLDSRIIKLTRGIALHCSFCKNISLEHDIRSDTTELFKNLTFLRVIFQTEELFPVVAIPGNYECNVIPLESFT